MTGAIGTVLIGSALIGMMIQMMVVEARKLQSDDERRLWRRWLTACSAGLCLLIVMPAMLEIAGIIPSASFGCASAVLFFLILVRSGARYCQRLDRLSAKNDLPTRNSHPHVETNLPRCLSN